MEAGERSMRRGTERNRADSHSFKTLAARSRKDVGREAGPLGRSSSRIKPCSWTACVNACVLKGLCRPTPECAAEPCNLGTNIPEVFRVGMENRVYTEPAITAALRLPSSATGGVALAV